jgi:hypothetical protein
MREPISGDATRLCRASPPRPRPVPAIRGPGPSYYLFQQGGQRMAITVLGKGTKIRINDSVELVVLDVCGEAVQIGLRCDSEAQPPRDAAKG